ncbi:MAG: alternative ribosome rescue aminoacyl-tRNA hydrolase ArfB [Planctomycetota bacterium]
MTDPAPNTPSSDDTPGGGAIMVAPGVRVARDAVRTKAVLSSGPGGQNVNKRATRVELRIEIGALGLPGAVVSRLRRIGSHLVTDAGEIVIACDEHRSQKRNKEGCFERLRELIVAAQLRPKVRKPTRPTLGSKRRRLEAKKRRGDIKRKRRRPEEG